MSKEAVEARYAATGDIICAGFEAQAQVTMKNDLITSAAQVFLGVDGCKSAVDPTKYTFVVRVDGKPQTYAIAAKTAAGWTCPSRAVRNSTNEC